MIFIHLVKRLVYSYKIVTVKINLMLLASFNFCAIAYLTLSYGYWNQGRSQPSTGGGA